MSRHVVGYRILFALVVVGIVLGGVSGVNAQDTSDDDNSPQLAGVFVDADGVLRKRVIADPGGLLMRERILAARAALDPNVAASSKLRKISLNRLEAALQHNQGVPTDTMRYLAGLQRVQYVFYYPESKDIVIAGPAQGWIVDPSERVVGIHNGRPTLQLQDLVVALRAFPPDGKETSLIACSIDPTQEGLARFQQFNREMTALFARNPNVPVEDIVAGTRESLGKQNVSITGVSPETHFAHVLVEADYRMKLIGLGLENPPIRLASYADRASRSRVASNAMQRWYFLPDYQCVRVADDGLAAELVGDGVKLIGADEMVTSDGTRKKAARGNRASRLFVNDFTMKYSQLAARSPVFAELRNVIDLSVAAALIQREGYYERSGWDLGILGDEKAFKVETYAPPKQVETAVGARRKGNTIMTPVGGGVHIEASMALDSENVLTDGTAQVEKVRQQVAPKLAEGQWWWD
ncbi:MAG: DUF1598 domain-containing protein [Pirellulales bacterium]|nr:DUF1598 domain-containing protein [Pirellulales bacterium]